MARKSFAYAIYAFKCGQLQSPYIETSRKHRSIEYGLSHTRRPKRFAWIDAYMIHYRYILNIRWIYLYIYIVPFLLETDHTFQISRTRTVKTIKVTTKTFFFHHQNVSYPQDRKKKKKTDLPHAASESDQDLSFAI